MSDPLRIFGWSAVLVSLLALVLFGGRSSIGESEGAKKTFQAVGEIVENGPRDAQQ